MRFSTKAEYGLRAIINLACAFPEQKTVKQISQEEKISLKYLERLMNNLQKNNLTVGRKGRGGGYTLIKKPAEIKVGKVIEILEGPIAPMKCKICNMENKCASSFVWNKLGEQIRKTLYKIKLSDLI